MFLKVSWWSWSSVYPHGSIIIAVLNQHPNPIFCFTTCKKVLLFYFVFNELSIHCMKKHVQSTG